MFESATLRLSAIYVGLLVLVSLFFSYNWYSVATSELDATFASQRSALRNGPFRLDPKELETFIERRGEVIEDAKKAVLSEIITVNLLFIMVAGVASYFLARRTLAPIKEAHEAQRRFTADASHELRTPIAAMQAEIEVALRDKAMSKQEAKALLNSNLEELAKLKDLSSNLLLIARQDEDGEITLHAAQAEKLVADAVGRVRKLARSKKVSIEQSVEKAFVSANNKAFVELLVVLLENAIKYSSSNTNVVISGAVTNRNAYCFTVRDQGRGIKSSDYERIFERFYRADQSRSKAVVDGNGLGLAIAQNIALQHDSRIVVSSGGPDKGSTFSIELALHQVANASKM